jgi:hypothetical protein
MISGSSFRVGDSIHHCQTYRAACRWLDKHMTFHDQDTSGVWAVGCEVRKGCVIVDCSHANHVACMI